MFQFHRVAPATLIFVVFMLAGCVTQQEPAVLHEQMMEPSIIAVSTPGIRIRKGASFAWLSKAVNVYRDERLDSGTIQFLIEKHIRAKLAELGYRFVDSEADADYKIAYTAALESALSDNEILRKFGLMPGNMRTPKNNPQYEKGTLVIYAMDAGGEVLWRSAAQMTVDVEQENEQRDDRIRSLIQGMFVSMPVG